MNTDNDVTQMEIHAETPAPPQKSKIPKAAWYVGGGCLILLCCAAVVALAVAGYLYFNSKDPIAAAVPGSSLVYMNIDFLQTQSDQFNKIVPIFQGIADVEKKPLADMLDEAMKDELDLSFKSDVMPWMGQHGAFVITGGDVESGDFEFMLVMEARDKALADAFLVKFVAALEDKNSSMKFEQKDVGGVTLYVNKSDFGKRNDTVIARSGSFVYLSNSEDPVISSINLKSADSLAQSDKYKTVMAALPAGSLTSVYVSGDITSQYMSNMSNGLGSSLGQVDSDSLSGLGFSLSVEDEGLRLDAAIAYDENKISDFQKDALKSAYQAPTADRLVPENTFFFWGANSSQSPAKLVQADNPMYTKDMQEAFDLFETQYNVNIENLLKMLTGEFAIAIGPSNDGPIAEQGQINVGATLFAATNDEAGFNAWAQGALDALSKESYTKFTMTDVTVADYQLRQLSVEGSGGGNVALYGADRGYIIIGTSQDILEKGLSGNGTLADSAIYKNTWKVFSSQSVPYTYANLSGFYDLYKSIPYNDLGDAEADLRKITVIAAALNQNSNYVSSMTLFMFINTK